MMSTPSLATVTSGTWAASPAAARRLRIMTELLRPIGTGHGGFRVTVSCQHGAEAREPSCQWLQATPHTGDFCHVRDMTNLCQIGAAQTEETVLE